MELYLALRNPTDDLLVASADASFTVSAQESIAKRSIASNGDLDWHRATGRAAWPVGSGSWVGTEVQRYFFFAGFDSCFVCARSLPATLLTDFEACGLLSCFAASDASFLLVGVWISCLGLRTLVRSLPLPEPGLKRVAIRVGNQIDSHMTVAAP